MRAPAYPYLPVAKERIHGGNAVDRPSKEV